MFVLVLSNNQNKKVIILEVFILINNQLLSTTNAKDFNLDSYCFDFRNESNRIFVLRVVHYSDKF